LYIALSGFILISDISLLHNRAAMARLTFLRVTLVLSACQRIASHQVRSQSKDIPGQCMDDQSSVHSHSNMIQHALTPAFKESDAMALGSSTVLKFHSAAPAPNLLIVVPFHHGELDDCANTLHLWSSFAACEGEPVADLVFVTSIHKGDLSTPKSWVEKPALHNLVKCFRKITYRTSQLTSEDDHWPVAPNEVFFWMMLDSGFSQDYKWIQQMELDVYPIKKNWLNAELKTIEQEKFRDAWAIGAQTSAAEGTSETNPTLNGNAVYMTDPKFIAYLKGYRDRLRVTDQPYDNMMPIDMKDTPSTGRLIATSFIINCALQQVQPCFDSQSSANALLVDALLVHTHLGMTSADLTMWRSGTQKLLLKDNSDAVPSSKTLP